MDDVTRKLDDIKKNTSDGAGANDIKNSDYKHFKLIKEV